MNTFIKSIKQHVLLGLASWCAVCLLSVSTLVYGQNMNHDLDEQVMVDVNTASAKAIAKAMQGVGMGVAKRIIEYREEYGPFQDISELVQVKGIGSKLLKKNIDKIKAELDQ